jgi:clan AA aspartic protease (TIGR02281 family)
MQKRISVWILSSLLASISSSAPALAETANVTSGVKTQIATHSRFDNQCRSALVRIVVLDPPRNGTVTSAPSDYVVPVRNLSGVMQPPRCVGQTLQGVAVFYQSKPGFVGADTFRYLRSNADISDNRFNSEITYNVTVAAPEAPARSASTRGGREQEPASGVLMKSLGGTYVIPAVINDAITLNFVVDSGAADVNIPADVVRTLIRTGSVSSADFIGTKTYMLADGSKIPSPTFRIRSLKVGDRKIANVTASVGSVESSLLLGQSFLARFRSWSIDNTRHVLILND